MADDELEARFQKFIAGPGSEASRLRDAFAQLIAQGNDQAVPMEAVMAAQGRQQLPPYQPNPHIDAPQIYSDPSVGTPMQRAFGPEGLEFPTAPSNPKISSEAPPAPFHGKGVIAETTNRPWEMPKSKKSKGKR